jgi:hypothetical protein
MIGRAGASCCVTKGVPARPSPARAALFAGRPSRASSLQLVTLNTSTATLPGQQLRRLDHLGQDGAGAHQGHIQGVLGR